jgi:Leucine-rich repeat (LRR) protein
MKYILKIFLIVLLVVAIIGAACWFFLVQRPDLTMSVFAHWGDYFYDAGRYNRAVSLYETACKLSPNNANLPVRLAQAYINSGNYTKAEYTLVSAITNNPESVQLYVALSKTYIEQDKILDAEQMLDRITSADVKAQIDALRPNAPVLSPESGYYSEYIDVAVTATGGTAYLAVNQDYPSIETDAYEAPVTLEAGDSKVVVVTVAENGLVSDAVYGGYTIGSVVEEVKLSDSALDSYVRELLGKTASDTIMSDELWEIEELTLPEGVQDISDLTRFAGLKTLTIQNATGLDLSVLPQLTTLQTLDLSGTTLPTSTLDAIGTLPELKKLVLQSCAVTAINPLVGLSNLEYLDLTNNSVSDLTAITALEHLKDLYLTNNPVKSITYLNSCLELERLHIENCGVSRLSSLAGNTSLQELYASNNEISDISVLSDCVSLSVLDISDNQVKDVSVIANLPELTYFLASHNQIESLPAFDTATCKLVRINVNNNQLTDLSPLKGLPALNYIFADYNQISDISGLEDCPLLTQLNLFDNPVNEAQVKALQEIGRIVNYTPGYVNDAA